MRYLRTVRSFIIVSTWFLALNCASATAQNFNLLAGRNFSASTADTTTVFTVEGDFNGDGKPDLVTVTNGQNDASLSILLGNADATFEPPVTISTGPRQAIVAIEVGDFNADGKLDFIYTLGQYGNNTIYVFLGNGDGSFLAPVTTTLADPPQLENGLAVADFNGDGRSDIALTASAPQQGAGTTLVLIGNGDGTFKAPVAYPTTALSQNLELGDFNGDGKLDLVAAEGEGFSVLLGNGDGTFQTAQNTFPSNFPCDVLPVGAALAVGDFNRDGKDDVAVSAAVFLSNGDGTFQSPICNTAATPNVVADFNHDGIPDLASISSNGVYSYGTSIYLGKGDGTFQSPITFQSSLNPAQGGPLAAIDFNGDGKIDLAGPSEGNTNDVTLVLGNGDGTFKAPIVISTDVSQLDGFGAFSFTEADLRHSGRADLLAFGETPIDGTGDLVTFLGIGNGTFQVPAAYTGANMTFAGAVDDFNNDGKLDVVTIGYSQQFAVLLGNGDGTFQSAAIYDSNSAISAVAVGDFNGDGNQDIVVPGQTGAQFYLGNGKGAFGFPVEVPGVPVGLVGDFNGDGKPDIAACNGTDVNVFLSNGNLTFQEETTSIGVSCTAATVADLNKDGKVDLVVIVAGGAQVLLGNGDGTFQSKGVFGTAPGPLAVAAADLNGDGIPDLAVACNGTLSVLLGNGDGTFQAAINYDDTGGSHIVAADFNGDGKVDLATDAFGITILFNGVGLMPGAQAAPTSLTFPTQGLNTTSPSQKVILTNTGGATLSVSQIAVTGTDAADFSQSNTCGSAVSANANCTISLTFTPTATGARSATLTIIDAVGTQTVALTGTGAAGLGLGTPADGSNAATVSAGATAKYTLVIGGNGLSGSVTLTCTGAPRASTCTLPGSVNVSATQPSQFTVSVTTTAPSTAALRHEHSSYAWFLATALLGMLCLPAGGRSRRLASKGAALLPLLLITFLISCGGGSGGTGGGGTGGTPAGTYSLTVTATMGSTKQSLALKLIVN